MKIYLDMDGVLADFFGGLQEQFNVRHWKYIPDIEKSLDSLKNTDFFYFLRTFEEFVDGRHVDRSKDLVKFVNQMCGDNWGICSSPLRGDHYNSAYWKRRWLAKHNIEPLPENIIFTSNKQKYAVSEIDGRPNILVDDKPSNIARWRDAGGIGIRYQANKDDLEDYLIPLLMESYK